MLTQLQHPEVRYEVTDHCNASCIMCPRDKHTRDHGVMEYGKYIKSINEIVKLNAKRVVLTGFGEPLLDKTLEQKIEYAKNAGLHTYIISNASALTEERAIKLLSAGLDEIRISYYGMEAESYNRVMRGLDHSRTEENLANLIAAKRVTKSKIKIQLSFLVLPENEKDVERFKFVWGPLVDYIEIWKPHNFGDGRNYRVRVGVKKTCGRPKNGPLQIQWNGDVIPCCYDYNNNIVLGNAFEQSILSILNGDKYNALRRAHATGKFYKFAYCDNCDQLLEHKDALIYSNRHDLPNEQAVQLSNTDLSNLRVGAK